MMMLSPTQNFFEKLTDLLSETWLQKSNAWDNDPSQVEESHSKVCKVPMEELSDPLIAWFLSILYAIILLWQHNVEYIEGGFDKVDHEEVYELSFKHLLSLGLDLISLLLDQVHDHEDERKKGQDQVDLSCYFGVTAGSKIQALVQTYGDVCLGLCEPVFTQEKQVVYWELKGEKQLKDQV